MDREETKKLLMVIQASYPNFNPPDKAVAVDTWHMMLEEYDYARVQQALKMFILSDTSGFAPSIGQLVARMRQTAEGDDIGEIQAWGIISRAIQNSGYHAKEEFDKLPPLLQRVVYSPANLKEWALMDADTVNSVIQSHVVRSYRATAKAAQEEAKLPPKFKATIKAQQKTPERLITKPAPDPLPEPEPAEHFRGAAQMVEDLKEQLRRET